MTKDTLDHTGSQKQLVCRVQTSLSWQAFM